MKKYEYSKILALNLKFILFLLIHDLPKLHKIRGDKTTISNS